MQPASSGKSLIIWRLPRNAVATNNANRKERFDGSPPPQCQGDCEEQQEERRQKASTLGSYSHNLFHSLTQFSRAENL